MVGSYARAVMRRRRGAAPADVPALSAVAERWAPSRDQLAAYARVCGLPERSALPITMGQLPVLRLQAALFGSPAFPFSAPGMVHIDNRFRQMEPLRPDRIYRVIAAIEGAEAHRSGIALRFRATIHEGSEPCWESCSTYLVRDRRYADADAPSRDVPGRPDGEPVHEEVFRIAESTGREYARVGGSGDWNPIHVHALPARLFGFPRAIAHGMWTAARMLGAVDAPLDDGPSAYSVWFGKPVFLPSAPTFRAWTGDAGQEAWHLRIEDATAERWHAVATLEAGGVSPSGS